MSAITALPREIVYEREAREYRATLDGNLIGYYPSYLKAEEALDNAAYDLLIDTAPIARCEDCNAVLGDLGRCETCDDRAAEPAGIEPISECYVCGAASWAADNHGPLCPDHAGVLREHEAESLTTALLLDGWETRRTHRTIGERNEYLWSNPSAHIVNWGS